MRKEKRDLGNHTDQLPFITDEDTKSKSSDVMFQVDRERSDRNAKRIQVPTTKVVFFSLPDETTFSPIPINLPHSRKTDTMGL